MKLVQYISDISDVSKNNLLMSNYSKFGTYN